MNQHERGRAVRRDSRLSWREKVILCELSDYQGGGESCWPNQTKLASDLGLNRSNLYRALADLERRGWLRRSTNGDGQRAFSVTIPDASVVSESHYDSVKTTLGHSVKTTPPVVSKQHQVGVKNTPLRCQNNTSSFNAQLTPRNAEGTGSTRRGALDFQGAPAEAAREALNAELREAGHTAKPRGGWNAQSAWQQVACDAADLAEANGIEVAAVLKAAARGFVAMKGPGRPEWWAEDVARYFDAGRKGAPSKTTAAQHGLSPVSSAEEHLRDAAKPRPAWMNRKREAVNA